MSKKLIFKRIVKFFLPYGLVKIIKIKKTNYKKTHNIVLNTKAEIYAYYKEYYKNFNFENAKESNKRSNNVYIYWHQGFENAPEIVKLCVKNIENQLYFLNIIKLDKNNIFNYCRFPDYILEKFNNGEISIQHFSDLIRCYLLINYGGFWIDSTVFLTKNNLKSFFSFVSKQKMFVFKGVSLGDFNEKNISSWFIYSKPHNRVLSICYEMLLDYWKTHNFIENYFLLHIFFVIASDYVPNSWSEIPTYNNINVHMLLIELFNQYSQDRFNYYCNISCVHKLTWKTDFSKRDFYTNYDYLTETIKLD